MKFILFKLNPKHHQSLKLKLIQNHMQNKKKFKNKNDKIRVFYHLLALHLIQKHQQLRE